MDTKIICEHRTYTHIMKTHDHEFIQLIMPLQGMLNIKTDTKEFKLDENHLFLLPSSCQHSFWAKDRNEFLVLDIPQFMFQVGEWDRTPGYKLPGKWDMLTNLPLTGFLKISKGLLQQNLGGTL